MKRCFLFCISIDNTRLSLIFGFVGLEKTYEHVVIDEK